MRNSWSQFWGEAGFVRISMSQRDSKKGVCGIYGWVTIALPKGVKDYDLNNFRKTDYAEDMQTVIERKNQE